MDKRHDIRGNECETRRELIAFHNVIVVRGTAQWTIFNDDDASLKLYKIISRNI